MPGTAQAKAGEQRDEGFTRESATGEQAVHQEGGAGNVAAVGEKGEKEKEDGNLRQKNEHPSDPGDYSIHHQTVEGSRGNGASDPVSQSREEGVDGVHKGRGPSVDSLEYKHVHGNENQGAEELVGENPVDLVRAAGAELGRLLDATVHQLGNPGVAGFALQSRKRSRGADAAAHLVQLEGDCGSEGLHQALFGVTALIDKDPESFGVGKTAFTAPLVGDGCSGSIFPLGASTPGESRAWMWARAGAAPLTTAAMVRRNFSTPWPRVAQIATTGTPRRPANRCASMWMRRALARSVMLRAIIRGRPVSTSWETR